jgi:hypothetical protein
MIIALIRYVISAVIDITADIAAFILAPLAALPVFTTTDANGREHIHPAWQWITTHDALVDTFAYGSMGRVHWLLKRYDTQTPGNNPAWLRYVNRLLWIWRNPAYQVSHWLGFDQRGVVVPPDEFDNPLWDTGAPNKAFWKVKNARGQTAFLYERQYYFYRNRCIEIQLGWKLYRNDPDQRCMVAFRVSPFKKILIGQTENAMAKR